MRQQDAPPLNEKGLQICQHNQPASASRDILFSPNSYPLSLVGTFLFKPHYTSLSDRTDKIIHGIGQLGAFVYNPQRVSILRKTTVHASIDNI